jgi:hypothetical protein
MNYPYRYDYCSDLFPPLSRLALAQLAALNNWNLPESYLDFLVDHNGMEFAGRGEGRLLAYQYAMSLAIDGPMGFKKQFVKWPRKRVHIDYCGFLDNLYGFSDVSANYDIRHQQKCYGFRQSVPNNFIAIGGSCSLTSVVMGIGGEWTGKIFHWSPSPDPDLPEEQHTLRRLHFASDNFLDFWNGLAEISSSAVMSE